MVSFKQAEFSRVFFGVEGVYIDVIIFKEDVMSVCVWVLKILIKL